MVNYLYDDILAKTKNIRARLCAAINTELKEVVGPVVLGLAVPIGSIGHVSQVVEIDMSVGYMNCSFGALLSDGTVTTDAMLSTETLHGIYGSLLIAPVR